MLRFIEKWKSLLKDSETDIKERVFCQIASIGVITSILAFLKSWVMYTHWGVGLLMVVLFITIVFSVYITIERHLLDVASVFLSLILMLLIFPGVFFLDGGIRGGTAVWFILGAVTTVLCFQGNKMHFFLTLNIISEAVCYLLAYRFPQLVVNIREEKIIYLDVFFSVVVVGVAVSMMMRFHIRSYAEQKQTVEWQKAELEKNNELQTHFFASMSHELRTPINTIIGLNNLIGRKTQEEETREYSEKIRNSSKMLLSLINDILDLSQLETKKMFLAENEYDSREMFQELIDIVGILADEKKLEFQVDIEESVPTRLFGDRKRIQQILINLLSNAVKYTSSGKVTLTVNVTEIRGEEAALRISVSDTGIGIRKEHLSNIYEVFKRVDINRNEKVEGSGLGLAITKQLVDLLGGEITVDSIYTKGSVFTVAFRQKIMDGTPIGKFDRKKLKTIGDAEKYQHLFEAPEARILVVDDIPTNCCIISELLEKTKVQVDMASSGEECLEKTEKKIYHLILMDHLMPGMDGIETLQKLRKQRKGLCRETPVYIMTATAISQANQFFQNLGFDGYIEKPIAPETLERVILSNLPTQILEYVREEEEAAKNLENAATPRQKKKKIMVTCDCVAEISPDHLAQMNMEQMYLYIQTDNGRFMDTVEIDIDNLFQYTKDAKITAIADSVSVEEYEMFFAEQLTKTEEVVHISMGKGCGKSYNVAVTAAESFDNVHVVDSGQVSCGERMLALYAAQMAMDGATVDEIIRQVKYVSKNLVTKFWIPDTGSFYHGGYTGYLVHSLCTFLGAHPILKIKKGSMKVGSFSFGSIQHSQNVFIKSMLRNAKKVVNDDVFVSYVGLNHQEQKHLEEEIRKHVKDAHIYMEKASLSCACNSGPCSIGISFLKGKNHGENADREEEQGKRWMYTKGQHSNLLKKEEAENE